MTSDEDSPAPRDIGWERPVLQTDVQMADGSVIHVLNVHFKSRIPTNIPGQKVNAYTWRSASAWAEGYFVSSMKRVGNAFGVRKIVDGLFEAEREARVLVVGDFNAEPDQVPVLAIRGRVEDTGNGELAHATLFPCQNAIAEDARYSLLHHGKGSMFDHMLASRSLFGFFRGAEIHNELIHDESVAFATDTKFPEPDHAPVISIFDL